MPLFSMPSTRSWGIGEIPDLEPMARWLEAAGASVLQLLPINEMEPAESSPYSAISAMAIDPQFIAPERMADFIAAGSLARLDPEDRDTLAALRASPRIDYRRVRPLKTRALRAAFEHFVDRHWDRDTDRAREFASFVEAERWWLDDYAIFRALSAHHGERPWTEWPELLRRYDRHAVDAARESLAHDVRFYQYVQWIAGEQWTDARRAAAPVSIVGDFPFMVAVNSADVWAHQDLFRLDASIGVPPDAFSDTGQNWGLPVYRWDAIAAQDDRWMRDRIRRSAALYDGYRIDHLVGFYRTYAIPHDGSPRYFIPEGEDAQCAQGERLMGRFIDGGSSIFAEDLGTVPDFVRESLRRLGLPGLKIMRWERHWHDEGQAFRDPASYPAASVAASGTHDTEPMAAWWERATPAERQAIGRVPTVAQLIGDRFDLASAPYDACVRDVLLEALYASGSNLLVLPIQDVFGWHDRINEPATVGDENWTYRLPWPVDRLDDTAQAHERATRLKNWAAAYGRSQK